MPLPASRNTTYAPGSEVKSVDLNDLQDQIIAIRGERKPMIPAAMATVITRSSWTQDEINDRWKHPGSPGADERALYPVPVCVGERIKSVKVYVWTAGATDMWARLACMDNSDGTPIACGAETVNGSGYHTISGGSLSGINRTVAENESYRVEVKPYTANDEVWGVEVIIDWP